MKEFIEKIADVLSVQDRMKLLGVESKKLGELADALSVKDGEPDEYQELLVQFMATLVAMRTLTDEVIWEALIDINDLSLWELWAKKLQKELR